MHRHALVIGSQTHGLLGAERDAARMAELLEGYDFDVDLRIGNAATRQGILDGYDALIAKYPEHAADREDAAAVVYYVGHGALALNQHPGERIRILQAIVPTDVVAKSPDFRAITAWELSRKLSQLTSKTHNVTVILDCCHAAQMSRDAAVRQAVPRALPHPLQAGFGAHLARLEEMYPGVALDPIGNPHAVRLVACAQHESAWEDPRPDGTRAGVFTEELIEVLHQVGKARVSWAVVGDAVRERVLRRFPTQRPEVEGPSERQLFSLAPYEHSPIVRITASGGVLSIHTGEILGTSEGDVYAAMPLGSTAYSEAGEIARLRVTRTAPLRSIVAAEWKGPPGTLPGDAVAVPLELAAPRHPVALITPGAVPDDIAGAIRAARTLRVAEPHEQPVAIATLRLADRQLTIEDPGGPIFPAARYPEDLTETIKNVANLGVARRIRGLVGEHGVPSDGLEIAWGVVEGGGMKQMPDQGASVGVGDRIYLKVRYAGYERRYVHVFNIGVRGRVTLLTKNLAPEGFALNSVVSQLVLGERDGALTGLTLRWPPGLTESSPRTDSLFVFVTATMIDLSALETREHLTTPRGINGTALQELLAQMQDGLSRAARSPAPADGFLVRQLSYQLAPGQVADPG